MAAPIPLLFSTGSLYPLDTAQCFELAAEAGFDGIEIMCDQRWSTRDPEYLRRLSQRTGLPVLAAHTPFSFRLPGWPRYDDQIAVVQATLVLAEAVGAAVQVIHLPQRVGHLIAMSGRWQAMIPWGNLYGKLRGWMADGGLAEAQAATTVRFCIENMPARHGLGRRWNFCHWNTLDAWPGVHRHLTLDTTHWATWGVDPLDAYRAANGRVAHIHLSNFDGREHRLPHRGDLDLGGFLRAISADGYAGTITVELHPDSLEFADAEALRRNLRDSVAFCREHLERGW
jgi:sugar phosphate isomerase/epimerase